jgi:hypothetical protein
MIGRKHGREICGPEELTKQSGEEEANRCQPYQRSRIRD